MTKKQGKRQKTAGHIDDINIGKMTVYNAL